MYGWNGVRGRYLADKVAQLSRRGCDVRVIHSDGGGYVVGRLRANGVRVRTASYDRNDNGTVDMYTHEKYMILSGNFGGRAGWQSAPGPIQPRSRISSRERMPAAAGSISSTIARW